MRKVIGTDKFIIYLYNGKNVRGKYLPHPKHFVFRQWGRIQKIDEDNKPIGESLPFVDYGEMISIINKIMRKKVQKVMKERRTWR